jgi:hypothetical protein
MKQTHIFAVAALILLGKVTAQSQGTFQNLDFENGAFVQAGAYPSVIVWSSAMPGWTGYIYTNQATQLLHNITTFGDASMSIYGPDYPSPGLFHGHNFVELMTGLDPAGSGDTVSPVLAQTGTLPASAKTIEFWATEPYAIGFDVSFRGQGIALYLLDTTSNGCYVWGGDISAYAGQTGQLSFLGTGYLDNIQFSNLRIPEPSVFGLSALGALLLGWRVLSRRR